MSQSTNSQQITQTIYNQIGSKAFYMLGAKNILSHPDGSLSFRIRGSRKVNYIKITLTSMDDYTMEFGKIVKFNYKVIKTVEGVYFDMLKKHIEAETGLYTSL